MLHDTFTRMWFELVVGVAAAWGVVVRWRHASMGDWMLLLWVAVGTLELLVHDVGNERRFVFLIPALIALTASVLGRGKGVLPGDTLMVLMPAHAGRTIILYSLYVLAGPVARLPFFVRRGTGGPSRAASGCGDSGSACWRGPASADS